MSLLVPCSIFSGLLIGSSSYESAVFEAAKSIKLSEQIFSENDVSFLYVRPGGILSTILIYQPEV